MTGRGEQPRSRSRRTRLFATCVPGLGRMLRRQLDAIDGVVPTGTGSDGRTDLVFFEADPAGRTAALRSRLAEDVFAEVSRSSRAGGRGAAAVAGIAWQPDAVQRALSVWAQEVRPLAGSMTFRVIARVRGEARFRRTDLRQALASVIGRDKPRWTTADAAQVEVWITEFHDGQYVTGLRLTGANPRRDADGDTERRDALRPTVAAAMVDLAGPPGVAGRPAGLLLDPCCGAGTILAAALAAGWSADGTDVDDTALEAAARYAPGARVQLGDARDLLLPDESVAACVSNLPFGRQSRQPGDWEAWASRALAEMSRVTRSGGAVVVLAPELPRPAMPMTLRLRRQVPLRLVPTGATIWVFRRA
jgi:23S rRNA G2445 N2-methylase RlmL